MEVTKGDARLQKTYTADFLSKRRIRNDGQVEQYYVENSHKPIIPKEEWEAVQMEIKRRADYCAEVGLFSFGSAMVDSAFTCKLVCAHCGRTYSRKSWRSRGESYWGCKNREGKNGRTCLADNVKDATIQRAFIIAWNSVVKDRDKLLATWEKMKKAGGPLEKMRTRQMIELTAQGPLNNEVPELTRMVLERIIVHSKTHFTVRFLNGTAREVCL